MYAKKTLVPLFAGVTVALLALSGCAGNGAGGSAAGTVAVDVGNETTVNLSTDPGLKVAVFIPGAANDFGLAQVKAAEETSQALGMDMTLFDAGYDPGKQFNQMQTAMASGGFDAAVVMSLDGVQSCKLLTEDFAGANILTSIIGSPLCDDGTNLAGKSVDEVWAPGTFNFVGSNTTRDYIDGWFEAAAAQNPGKQEVLLVSGPTTNALTRVSQAAMESFAQDNSEYTFDSLFTDWTTTDAYNQTQTYLQGHPDTTLIMSMSAPDLTRGAIQAVSEAGLSNQIKIVDLSFGAYMVEQIEAGTVQASTMLFPYNQMKLALESIAAAQAGDPGDHFVDDSLVGTAADPFVVTKETLGDLPDELR